MKIAILGYGGQGQSAYEYWQGGNDITVCDANEKLKLPEDVSKQLGPGYLRELDRFDLLIRTPALHPRDIVKANGPEILDKVWTNTNEFMKVVPTKNIIGITGTKGKGTTSTLIAKMLEAAGKRVHLGGNIGIPPLDMLKKNIQSDDWVVLELANFQLIDLKHSPHIAVVLMLVPEHLDWHRDFEDYLTAKQQLFMNQNYDDIAIYYAHNQYSRGISTVSEGHKIPYMSAPGADVVNDNITIEGKEICSVKDLKLLGKHNWQNVCAAVTAVWQISQDAEAMRSVLTTFGGLEHRLEFVRELDGVKYYDDSFGTTPETAIVAIETFTEPKVVILGGSDKGASYELLARVVKENNVRKAVLIGDTGSAIGAALKAVGFEDIIDGGTTMTDMVLTARQAAEPGDIVLLSTGCASFGLFQNYKDRGDQFRKAVLELA